MSDTGRDDECGILEDLRPTWPGACSPVLRALLRCGCALGDCHCVQRARLAIQREECDDAPRGNQLLLQVTTPTAEVLLSELPPAQSKKTKFQNRLLAHWAGQKWPAKTVLLKAPNEILRKKLVQINLLEAFVVLLPLRHRYGPTMTIRFEDSTKRHRKWTLQQQLQLIWFFCVEVAPAVRNLRRH